METQTLIDIQARVRRLERHNRILTMTLCALIGVASIAAAKHSDSILSEVRTQRLTLVDNRGKPLVDTQCVNGVEIRAYLPHDVIQR